MKSLQYNTSKQNRVRDLSMGWEETGKISYAVMNLPLRYIESVGLEISNELRARRAAIEGVHL